MRPTLLVCATLVALFAGCVPLSEPLGDIDKAEPDKALIGAWTEKRDSQPRTLTIDVPEVKGNPKGLMREGDRDCWFHVTRVGKERYATVILPPNEKTPLQFDKEGKFAEWSGGQQRFYFAFRYSINGDELTIVGMNEKAFDAVMKAEMVNKDKDGLYKTSPGWLAKYLEKNGPDKIFPGSLFEVQTYERVNKK